MQSCLRLVLVAILTAAGLIAAVPAPAGAAGNGSGYWMLTADGHVHGFGGAARLGDTISATGNRVDIEPTPSGLGYWVLAADGGLFSFGDAGFFGRPASTTSGRYVSLSATPSGRGYWVFTDRGIVFAYGDAIDYGGMGHLALNGPILASVATPSGRGYWMVGSDGGIFSLGDARFFGSMGGQPLNRPVMSMVADPDGAGYWLVASDGGIFAFDAPFYGSMGSTPLNKPVSGMVGGPGGYLMVAEDGGIFTFGAVAFHGSLGANPPPSPVVAVAVIPEASTSVLAGLRIAPEDGRSGYSRDLFNHWIDDSDPDSCDTRQEVLLEESLLPATRDAGCPVSVGQWFSVYDGVSTTDPSTFDVDHVVALAEAWDSGAARWDQNRRRDYANDLGYAGSLIAVSASSNRSKSDRDPAEWMPERREAWCSFATAWTHVKIRWDLSADEAEAAALRAALSGCDASPAPPVVPGSPSQPAPPPPPPAVTVTITGLDCGAERVTVRNGGSQGADLTGWKIYDAGRLHTYTFPGGYSLGAGASVAVKSGGAAGPGELHWMNGFVWNNDGDTASLVDPDGATRSTRSC
jgi:hypothetical protein